MITYRIPYGWVDIFNIYCEVKPHFLYCLTNHIIANTGDPYYNVIYKAINDTEFKIVCKRDDRALITIRDIIERHEGLSAV